MPKTSTEHTKTIEFFKSYLENWLKKSGLNKTEAAKRFGLTHSLFINFLNGKKGISLLNMEKICQVNGQDFLEALEMGRTLCGEKKETKNLTPFQIEALSAFKECLMAGGEAAEMLALHALNLAVKKQAGLPQKPFTGRLASKSA
jgi:transcriptional regulator with XRE-family HTH domain